MHLGVFKTHQKVQGCKYKRQGVYNTCSLAFFSKFSRALPSLSLPTASLSLLLHFFFLSSSPLAFPTQPLQKPRSYSRSTHRGEFGSPWNHTGSTNFGFVGNPSLGLHSPTFFKQIFEVGEQFSTLSSYMLVIYCTYMDFSFYFIGFHVFPKLGWVSHLIS